MSMTMEQELRLSLLFEIQLRMLGRGVDTRSPYNDLAS